jgi:hypothetical protein
VNVPGAAAIAPRPRRIHHPCHYQQGQHVSAITICGGGDDLIEVAGCEGAGESGCSGSQEHALSWHAALTAPGGPAMQVMAWYGPGGCWLPGIGQAGADRELRSWPVTIARGGGRTSPAYGVVLPVGAPEGTHGGRLAGPPGLAHSTP